MAIYCLLKSCNPESGKMEYLTRGTLRWVDPQKRHKVESPAELLAGTQVERKAGEGFLHMIGDVESILATPNVWDGRVVEIVPEDEFSLKK